MNRLTVSHQQSIHTLHALGWSARRIARELGVHRETVGRELRLSKPAKVTAGSESEADSKPAKVTTGSDGRSRSQCEEWRPIITESLQAGLSARRIFQDLQTEKNYTGGYESVKRFVRVVSSATALPFRRIETAPGEEMQVDFGQGAPVIDAAGKRRRPHLFRATLSYSRKGYSEVVSRQDTESFLRCLENAFRRFGGVPKSVIPDNLKAAVLQADWFDPEINPKLMSFAAHYGTVILPTKPRTPQHKGKVEAGVKYVKNNALKGRKFASLADEQQHLQHWEATVADTRIHGTTKRQVGALFETAERAALLALPAEPFANFREAQRNVNRDGHVEVAKAYYSAPPEYLGRTVWVRWDARLVRIFNHRFEQVALHLRSEPGRFNTLGEHLAAEKIGGLERGAGHLLAKANQIGDRTHE